MAKHARDYPQHPRYEPKSKEGSEQSASTSSSHRDPLAPLDKGKQVQRSEPAHLGGSHSDTPGNTSSKPPTRQPDSTQAGPSDHRGSERRRK